MNKPGLKTHTQALIRKFAHKPLKASITELNVIMCSILAKLAEQGMSLGKSLIPEHVTLKEEVKEI